MISELILARLLGLLGHPRPLHISFTLELRRLNVTGD